MKDPEADSCDPTRPITLVAGVAAGALWALTMLALPVIAWLDQLSRQAGPSWPRSPVALSLAPSWRR